MAAYSLFSLKRSLLRSVTNVFFAILISVSKLSSTTEVTPLFKLKEVVNSPHLLSVDLTKPLASSDKSSGNSGCVGCVAILNRAAIGSNSAHGGLVVNISTTVHPRLLQTRDRMKLMR